MKSKLSLKNFMSVIVLCLFVLTSCTKESTTEPTPDNTTEKPKGILKFHLHTVLDNNEVDDYNIIYTCHDGRKVSLSLAQLFISNIELIRLDGSIYSLGEVNVLKVLHTHIYTIAEVPVGNYKGIRFKVGLNANRNFTSPNASADSTILNDSNMWFSTSPQTDGYVFMNVKGQIDTSFAKSGVMGAFEYKIGTPANYQSVVMPASNFSILKDKVEYAHILIDFYQLFNGVDVSKSENLKVLTSADNNSAIAKKIYNNIPLMFSYEL